MARAYSLDLRERGVAAVASGQSCRSVAKTFMVSVASVVKWSQRQRAIGSPAALKMGGHRPYLVARERDWVLSRLVEKPDLTLRALLKELANRGLVVSYYALWHFLHHEGVKRPSVDGEPSPFWRRCVATGSLRPASSTDQSMARASTLMSNKFSCPSSRRATLSSSTTSAATRAGPFAQRSAAPRPSSSSCPPTRQTSIQSSRPSPK